MYETEANSRSEESAQLPAEVIRAFGTLRGKLLMRSVLPWSEHCTECAWPTCYSTCDLYTPREDGRCRRFADGMVRVNCPTAMNGYLLKIRFKRWAKLWTPGRLHLHSISKASRIERRDHRVGNVLYQISAPQSVKKFLIKKRYVLKKRLAVQRRWKSAEPTGFLLECFNPGNQVIDVSFSIRSSGAPGKIPYQKLIPIKPGFQCVRVPASDISSVLDLDAPFSMELVPNDIGREVTLYFGFMDFAMEAESPVEKSGNIKCVVWDLDNTLWDGILVEQGVDGLKLKPKITSVIKELDRRGIIQSVASKNHRDEAMAVLKSLQLDEYFLYPQISWAPKSDGIKTIARHLNIGIDAMLFVDDSEFELQQVQSACSGIRVLQSQHYSSLLTMPECQVPVTEESKSRRKMYKVEQARQTTAETFKDDYTAFLRHCSIQVTVQTLTAGNLERVHELTQRTNQMNFSGNRYDRDVLRQIIGSSSLDAYVISCEDRFGSYGIVGFSTVDNRVPRLTDLMFSCRIQSKRVEHAFLLYVIRKYTALTGTDFYANYRKTARNSFSGQVFADLSMQEVEVTAGVTSLVFPKHRPLPDEDIVTLIPECDNVQVGNTQ